MISNLPGVMGLELDPEHLDWTWRSWREWVEIGRSTSKYRGRDVHDTRTIPMQHTHKPRHRGAELEAGCVSSLRGAPRLRFDCSVCPEGLNEEADSGSEGAG